MRPLNESMGAVTLAADPTPDPILVEHWREKTVQFFVDGGTFQLEGSIDGTNFVNVGAAVATDSIVKVADSNGAELQLKFLRVNTTSDAGGSQLVTIAGLHTRTDGG